ncbi:MAG: hypothetical protein ACFB0D_01145 [Phormidesmis sp.]
MMNTPQNLHQLHQRYPGTEHLSETYLQLEGFVETDKADFTLNPVTEDASQFQASTWQDMAITLSGILIVLVVSSAALGIGASKLTEGLQHLAKYAQQQQVDRLSPTSWRF